MTTETARFCLRSYPLNDTVRNPNDTLGFNKNNNTSFTWNNINLRVLLGHEMYEKYDTFNIAITSISNAGVPNEYSNSQNDCMVNIVMSGLNFINSTYEQITGNNTNKCFICTYEFPPLGSHQLTNMTLYPYNVASAEFSKSSDIINLTIEYRETSADNELTPINIYPEICIHILITGVKISNYANTNYTQLQLKK